MSSNLGNLIYLEFKHPKEAQAFAKIIGFDYNKFSDAPNLPKDYMQKWETAYGNFKYLNLERIDDDNSYFQHMIIEFRVDEASNPSRSWKELPRIKIWSKKYRPMEIFNYV